MRAQTFASWLTTSVQRFTGDMPCFRSMHDLEQSLRQARRTIAESPDIAASLRPVVPFLRRQVPDASCRWAPSLSVIDRPFMGLHAWEPEKIR